MSTFARKIIAVTGGSSDIGLATARQLARLQATVVVGDLSSGPSAALQELIDKSDSTSYTQVDVTARISAQNFLEGVINKFGRLDGLVNNAGICLSEGEKANDEIFDRTMLVNLKGAWIMGTEAIEIMRKQESRGSIVNTASDAALKGVAGIPAYTASKHGVLGLTRAWCKEWTPHGLRINAVAPGVTETPMIKDLSPDIKSRTLANVPMGRFAQPSEIASVICFLLGDESSFISGQCIRVGGGEGE